MGIGKGDTILITGAAGFLGKHVVQAFNGNGYTKLVTPSARVCDLREQVQVRKLMQDVKPDLIVHLAATVGGIGANQANPARYAYENAIMGVMLIEESHQVGTKKFVTIGTICSYPKHTPIPFKEEDLWSGYPEETNAPYGLAKKMLLVQGQAYRQQYDYNVIHLMPVNLYGPGDNFSPFSSHVIPAMIEKCMAAIDNQQDEIVLWGDGSPTREFLYVEDAARAIVLAAEVYDGGDPLNIGSGFEISIKDLAQLVVELTGFKGKIKWDASKPNGQPLRRLDCTRAKQALGYEARVDFREGLEKMISWYKGVRGSEKSANASQSSTVRR